MSACTVPRTVARVNNPKNAWLFNAGMGVDVGLNQADLMAHLVVEEMNQVAMLTLLKISRGTYSIVQYKVGDAAHAVGKQVRELGLSENALLVALYKGDKTLIPHGDTVVDAGDVVLAFADENAQRQLNGLFR